MLALQNSGSGIAERAPIAASGNQLLARIPQALTTRWGRHLEHVTLPTSKVLYDVGDSPDYVLFPEDAVVCLVHSLEDGDCAEVAIIGRDGMVGIAPFMAGGMTSSSAVVYSGGTAHRLPTAMLNEACEASAELEGLLLLYTQALITQMAQTAVCNRHHNVLQQLSRFLLMSIDRLPGNRIDITQEAISHLLGVRREGVTTAAGRLQRMGCIEYRRGHIEILDRRSLEQQSCECYGVVSRETERLLPALKQRAEGSASFSRA